MDFFNFQKKDNQRLIIIIKLKKNFLIIMKIQLIFTNNFSNFFKKYFLKNIILNRYTMTYYREIEYGPLLNETVPMKNYL